jgi:hypothetical protein
MCGLPIRIETLEFDSCSVVALAMQFSVFITSRETVPALPLTMAETV